jgi:beta-lactamase superfamily II metal-dependent hydrolase
MTKQNFLFLLLFNLLFKHASFPQPVSGDLEVHYLNVGQADAILIICPTGDHKMLIDAGDTRYPGSSTNFKSQIQALLPLGSTIDVVVASHPHADHIGSMRWVFQNYSVSRYIDNGQVYESNLYDSLMSTVFQQTATGSLEYETASDVSDEFPDFCTADNVDAEIIMTDDLFDNCSNQNDCSVILKVNYNDISFLFPGDAEEEEEEKLLNDSDAKKKLNADVYKAAHHGSNTSNTFEFLKSVSPRYIVVSCGEKNVGTNSGYKHPRLETINNFNLILKSKILRANEVEVYNSESKVWVMKKVKARVLFTKIDGRVTIKSNGKTIRVIKEN